MDHSKFQSAKTAIAAKAPASAPSTPATPPTPTPSPTPAPVEKPAAVAAPTTPAAPSSAEPPAAPATPAAPEPPKPPEPKLTPEQAAFDARLRARERALAAQQRQMQVDMENFRRQQAEFQSMQSGLLKQFEPEPKPPTWETEAAQLKQQNAALQQQLAQIARERQLEQARAHHESELQRFEREAKDAATSHPLTSALAAKDPQRLRRMGLAFAQQDPTLTNAEYLDRIEEELGLYAGLRGSPAAPSAPQPPATPPPGPATSSASTPPVRSDAEPPRAGKLTEAQRRKLDTERAIQAAREVRERKAAAAAAKH
jgi:hypothetical protein